jgi:RND family efflux transporter MFP subunit
MSHRHSRAGIVLSLLSFTLFLGCEKPAAKPREAPPVTVAQPEIRSLKEEEDYNGWLVANKFVELRARVQGHIKDVLFKDGDLVEKGQPLFVLDLAPFQADLKQAEAQIKAFEAQKVFAQKDADRYEALQKTGAASKQDLDKAVASVDSFTAQILAQTAEADRKRLDLEYATIVAPISGKISKAELVEGDYVNAGGTNPVLTTITATEPIYVDFNVDERAVQEYAARKKEDLEEKPLRERKVPFSFALDTEEGFPHEGILIFADNKFSQTTGTVLLRGEAENPHRKLVPGSRVRVRVPISDAFDAVVVPDLAILSDQDRRYLLVIGEENKVLRRDITLGRLLDDGTRVVLPPPGEKLPEGTTWADTWKKAWIITLGLQRARLNEPVQPVDADGKPVTIAAK